MILLFGASGGLGQALSNQLGDEVLAITRKQLDMADSQAIQHFFDESVFYLPSNEQLHIVNATGVSANGLLQKQMLDDFDFTWEVNTRANWLVLKHAQPLLKSNGGSVTFLSSIVASIGVAGCTAYGTSKAALHGLVRSAARELGHIGARCNAIELGYFDVGMIKQLNSIQKGEIIGNVPLRRLGKVEEAVEAVRFCIKCEYLNGAVVRVNGGLV